MSKTIHIHIHRAPAKDAWEESKHKRAANGQFGSGGGATKATAPKVHSDPQKNYEHFAAEFRKISDQLKSAHRTPAQRKLLVEKQNKFRALMNRAHSELKSAAPAKDAWEESKHKRAANGQFGSGGGGAAAKPAAKSAPAAAKPAANPAASAPPHKLTVGAKYPNGKPAYGTLEVGGKKYQFTGKEDGRVEMGLQAFSSMEKAVSMLGAPGSAPKKTATPAKPATPTELPPHRLVVSGKHPNGKPAYGTLEVGGKRYHYSGREDGGVEFGVQGFSSMERAVAALGAAKPAAKSTSAKDAWEESKHKRAANGQFGSGGAATKPAAPKADNPQNVATQLAARKNQLKELQAEMKTGKYSPEDVAELKNKEASLKRMIANYESKSAAPKTDWSKSNGDWTAAKKEGAEMFERALSSAKTGGDRTDAALKLKAEAAEQQKNGSYLGAVVLGLVNDYFDRLK